MSETECLCCGSESSSTECHHSEPTKNAHPFAYHYEVIAWLAFYNQIIASKRYRELFLRYLSSEEFVELFSPLLAPIAPVLASIFRKNLNSSNIINQLATFIYINYYWPLSDQGPFKIEQTPEGADLLCWRHRDYQDNEYFLKTYLSLTMIEVDGRYIDGLQKFGALRTCSFQGRPGCLFGLGILAAHRVGAEVIISKVQPCDRVDIFGRLQQSNVFIVDKPQYAPKWIKSASGSLAVTLDWAANSSIGLVWNDSTILNAPRTTITSKNQQNIKKRKRAADTEEEATPILCPRSIPDCELCRKAELWTTWIDRLSVQYPELILKQFYGRKSGTKARPLTERQKQAIKCITRQTTYATLSESGVNALVHSFATLDDQSTAADIGSGQGLAIMQIVFQTGCFGTGIELRSDLTEAHEKLWNFIVSIFPFMEDRVLCIQSDFQSQKFSEFDFLFSNNICFDRVDDCNKPGVALNHSLAMKYLLEVPAGVLVTTFGLSTCSRDPTLGELGIQIREHEVPGFRGMFSWQDNERPWYFYGREDKISTLWLPEGSHPTHPPSQSNLKNG